MVTTIVQDRLYETVSWVLGVDAAALTESSSPETIESWDSLNHLNLVMALESEYDVSLSPEDTLKMHDVGSIRGLLDQHHRGPEADISFVDCRGHQLPAVRAFIERSYGAGYVLGANDAYFRWQFEQTPISKADDYHLRLAVVEGEIAGCLGYIPLEISLGGRVVHGAWLANWMVDPRQRQLGLGPLLVRDVSGDFDICLAVGPNRQAHDILSRMGWTDFGRLPRYVAVLDVQQAQTLTETGDLPWPKDTQPREHSEPAGLEIRLVDHFDREATELWDRLWGAEVLSAGTRRTAAFLNWRYATHPQFPYRLFEARQGGRLVGIAVYRVEQARDMPVRVGRLVELVGDEDAEKHLLGAVLDDARCREAAAVDFFCPSVRLERVLGEHGFLPGDHPCAAQIPILYQPIDRRKTGIPFMADLRKVPEAEGLVDWYVTKADGDQDRPN